MKYLESNLVRANVVILMKVNDLSYMIKYLPCLLVNLQTAIYGNLLFAKCRAF